MQVTTRLFFSNSLFLTSVHLQFSLLGIKFVKGYNGCEHFLDLPRPCERSLQGGPSASCFPNNGRFMEKAVWEGGDWKRTRRQKKEKQKYLLLCCILTLLFYVNPQGDQQAENKFNITWLRVRMSYHIFNNLAELLNGDLAAKIRREIFSKHLMDR